MPHKFYCVHCHQIYEFCKCIPNGCDAPLEKIRYKTRPIRMHDKTWEQLKNEKIKSGKSWNLFLIELLKFDKN